MKMPYQILIALLFFTVQRGGAQVTHADNLTPGGFDSLKVEIMDTIWNKDQISIIVRVEDAQNNFVTGLTSPNRAKPFFSAIVDKGKKEICQDFKVIEATEANSPVPLNFSLVLDYSGSMIPYYGTLQTAAQRFMDNMPNAKFARVNFDDNIDVVNNQPVKFPQPTIRDNLNRYGGSTALYAAVDAGVETLRGSTGAHFVVVFTDGFENASAGIPGRAFDPIQLVSNARAENAAIYAVGFDLAGYPMLNEICSYSGGKYVDVWNIDNLIEQFSQLSAAYFSRFYVIQATCTAKETVAQLKTQVSSNGTVAYQPISKGKPGFPTNWDGSVSFGVMNFEMGNEKPAKKYDQTVPVVAERIVQLLKNDPAIAVEIHGHASPDGEETGNAHLSYKRAKTVYDQILKEIETKHKNDIDALMALNRISFKFFGESRPLYPETSVKNFENRRVEIVTRKI